MPIKIAKWGNSLGIRIPKHLAEQVQLQEGDEIEISTAEDKLIVTPLKRKKYTLEQLLEGMGEENLHSEIDWGEATGKEQW
ncbi:transcriptional regulator/antitoxin, MazE [Stanieria cyanosphaera PCC 7437]|uniref:Transcriptional regulator/antitoxin, MazE n=1 Tax=Stanieria cyanosphaera (strain ATCC 29371 / PCC 7437) TaxID=111780 RepID=K9XY66_STAC7|nr:AbrB/MazE/SpoVT family DNA-binding domain-containing protein [Stanieria cyanosphaera]AFZ37004.1 transcriptional regulator/antitoxin, MazE [Stanieria cyanosphaera PCC 7437]